MASTEVTEIATLATNLRSELKEWERAFASTNEGRKAGRSDIKKVPEIAAKYKEYSRLKALESSTNRDKHAQLEERPKKRKHPSPTGPENGHPVSTPRKASKGLFVTPSKSRTQDPHPAKVDPYDSPSVFRRLFSPSTHMHTSPLKTAIGPTPQRDGKALGLFDLLSESGGSTATPTATKIASVRGASAQTPSKRRTMDTIAEEEEEEDDSPRGERTPASSGKKFMLSNLFATPTAWRYSALMENENRGRGGNQEHQTNTEGDARTPAGSDTPSFLRRSNTARFGSSNAPGHGGGLSPIAARKPPQFVGKGLTAIVQGLRDMEEERLQDDLDVLDEIEAEQAAANVEVNDSQAPANNTYNGRPYKKKGQKRTTRKVRMKPVISKSKPDPHMPESAEEDDSNDEEQSDDELAAVPHTQGPIITAGDTQFDVDGFEDTYSIHTMSEPDFDSDPEYGGASKPITTKAKSFSEKMKEAIGDNPPPKEPQDKTSQPPKETEPKKPRERKINPQAHANYRSLKIRNRGTKGRGAGRFRRR